MKNLLLALLLIFAKFSFGQNFNRPYPNTLSPYEFVRYDQTHQGKHFLMAPFFFYGNTSIAKSMQVIDEDGYNAWFYPREYKIFDFKYHPIFDRYSFSSRSNGVVKHYELNANFELIDSLTIPSQFSADAHEFQIFPNGNKCVIGVGHTTMDLSTYNFNGVQGSPITEVSYTVILEYDPSGNIVFQWESPNYISVDHFSPYFNYSASHFDYLHANAVELDTDGNLLVSMRTSDLITKINRTTGDVMWKLGGTFSDFTFTNDAGFFGQHDIRRNSNGNITVFDNDFPSNNARGVEYELDTINWTATRVSETVYAFNFPAKSMGSYRMLENDYSIAGWGNTRRPAPSVTLFDPLGNVASDFFFQDTVLTYRAFFQELPTLPSRQIIDCQETQTGVLLSVPDTSLFYLWSSSGNSSSIEVTGTGTFQCWVNQGIGLMGSYPIEILSAGQCPTLETTELKLDDKKIVSYFDLQGRKIMAPIEGKPYLILFSDGSVERQFAPQF